MDTFKETEDYFQFIRSYQEAMDFLMVQIKILNEDYREKYRDYPIHNIQSRIKEKESIVENWTDHCRTAGACARKIAERCKDLDGDRAYAMGLLHDIGRREGVMDMKHIICGYRFMKAMGYVDIARICLTHSFPYKNIKSYNGKNDCSEEETIFIKDFLEQREYDDYDRLVQLCDALALPTGFCLLEKRFVDVAIRYGTPPCTVDRWKKIMEIKDLFEQKIHCSIYELLPGAVENSFGIY